jgi:hypothetical protein
MKNTLWHLEILNANDRRLEFSKQFRRFDQHKQDLLKALARGCARNHTVIFNRAKAWRDLQRGARLYFLAQKLQVQSTPVGSRRRQLEKLLKALRQAGRLSQQAFEGEIGGDLYRAFVGEISPSDYEIEQEGSSALVRKADALKAMVEPITNLEKVTQVALQLLKAPADGGRAMLFPRDCLQGLGRIYFENTGAVPGRGLGGPFADFTYEFFIAVGLKNFSYGSLVEAIKDAHRRHKDCSWLGKK